MHPTILLFLASTLSSFSSAIPNPPDDKNHPAPLVPQPLNLTTLTGNAKKESVIECWSITPLTVSDTPGIQGALVGNLGTPSKLTYFDIPPKFDGGLHNAPAVQYVYFTSGRAKLSLPTSPDTATIKGGAYGLILAADTAEVSAKGHTTVYESAEQTIGLVIPLAGNKVPEHTVLHKGACTEAESRTDK